MKNLKSNRNEKNKGTGTDGIIETEEGRFTANKKLRLIRIPKQNFKVSSINSKIPPEIEEDIKSVFDLFVNSTGKVNPNEIKKGLRSVDFHKESPQIYRVVEDLCFEYDQNEELLSFDDFIAFLNKHLVDINSRVGTNKIFDNICNPEQVI